MNIAWLTGAVRLCFSYCINAKWLRAHQAVGGAVGVVPAGPDGLGGDPNLGGDDALGFRIGNSQCELQRVGRVPIGQAEAPKAGALLMEGSDDVSWMPVGAGRFF